MSFSGVAAHVPVIFSASRASESHDASVGDRASAPKQRMASDCVLIVGLCGLL